MVYREEIQDFAGALLLILQIPYAVSVALCIAIFDILPVLGTGGILLPWAVILFAMGKVPLGIGIVALSIFVQVRKSDSFNNSET